MNVILSLDLGTTGVTVLALNGATEVLSRGYCEVPCQYPQPGWVEQDPEGMLEGLRVALAACLADLPACTVAGIGITNQRETIILWDRATGKSVHPAIVWQCRRTTDVCERLVSEGHADAIKQKTGLVVDAYFSASKIQWILTSYPDLARRATDGELAVGTVDSWVLWHLSGGEVHATDYTNASRTMLFNIDERIWDGELCELFSIPVALLPTVKPSSGIFGHTKGVEGVADGTPLAGVAGDQQAALFGQGCVKPGQIKNTYGTGCFMLTPLASRIDDTQGLLTTLGVNAQGEPCYALEGAVFMGGALVQWLRDELGIIQSAAETETLAATVEDTGGVVIVPAFVGLGAPHWDPHARGSILGASRGTGKAQLALAALEAIAFQSAELVQLFETVGGVKLGTYRVDGGACANSILMQFQADICGVTVERPAMIESTALGAGMLAGLAVGMWQHAEEAFEACVIEHTFAPCKDDAWRNARMSRWSKAVDVTREFGSSD